VENDERERGLRETLNYGHTFGHALEAVTDYNTYRHGEAVAIGMNCAAHLAVNRGMLAPEDRDRQKDLLQRAGLPVYFPRIPPEILIDKMYLDKKTRSGKLRLVLSTRLGEVIVRDDVEEEAIAEAILQCTKDK
jgi:3-dehydroquinate synthase